MPDEVEIRITSDNQSGPGLTAAQDDIKGVGKQAETAAPKVKALGDRLEHLDSSSRRSSQSSDAAGGRLDKLGDSADETEGKFTGLASGIDGATSLMDDPSPQEMAQGLADLADGAANFLVPALKSAGNAVSGMAQRLTGATTGLGAMGRAAGMAAGVAGIGAVLFAVHQLGQARAEAETQKLADDFIATGESATIAAAAMDQNVTTMGELGRVFDKLLETSPELAEQFKKAAEEGGISNEVTDSMQESLDKAADKQKGLEKASEDARSAIEIEADEIRAFNDEVDRLIGKTFGLSEAQARLTIAVADAAETVKDNREEIGEAATSLDINTEAGANNILMLENLVRAEADVIQAMKDSGATNAEVAAETRRGSKAIEDQAAKMGFNRGQVEMLTGALKQIPSRLTTKIGIVGREQSINDIKAIQREINAIHGRDVGIRIVGTSVGVVIPGGGRFAHGGITGAAGGGPRGGMVLVGEHGPELAELPFGSRVHSNPDTQRMLADQGGVTVNQFITIEGSLVAERDVIRRFRDEVVRGGLGVVARS